jgi:hypothetical protein
MEFNTIEAPDHVSKYRSKVLEVRRPLRTGIARAGQHFDDPRIGIKTKCTPYRRTEQASLLGRDLRRPIT